MTALATEIDLSKSPQALLLGLAKDTIELVDGDLEQAEDRIRYLLKKERAKWFGVVVDYVAEELVRQVRLQANQNIKRASSPNRDRGLDSLKANFDVLHEKYASWRLSSGVELIRATRREVEAQAAFYHSQGKTMMAQGDWFTAIARKMGAAETVGEALTGKDLYELHEEAVKTWTSE